MHPQTITRKGNSILTKNETHKVILNNRRKNKFEKNFCEFFAGIGLVREGLHSSKWNCIYANDIDQKKMEMYGNRFGMSEDFHLGDVWNTNEVLSRILDKPFLATASFPCTDLSLAGKRRGLAGDHSSAFYGFINTLSALGEKRPKLVMLENVTGFISSHDGKDFSAAVNELANLGYWIDCFVLDAKHFVPQSRPRVFIVGLHESVESPRVIKRSTYNSIFDDWGNAISRQSQNMRPKKLLKLMQEIELKTGWMAVDLEHPMKRTKNLKDIVDIDDAQEWWDIQAVKKHYAMMSNLHQKHVDVLCASHKLHIGSMYRRGRNNKARAEIRFDGTAGCLRTPRGGSARQIIIVINKGELRMRWMSPREYARLQGADHFPLVEKKNQNLFGFGDAVCVPVIEWIDNHILTPIFDSINSNPNYL
jgi:DNA (cytosine-5)-methyltransferase 1